MRRSSTPLVCCVPLPLTLSAFSERHRVRQESGWRILTPRHAPSPDLYGHLTFALAHAVMKYRTRAEGDSREPPQIYGRVELAWIRVRRVGDAQPYGDLTTTSHFWRTYR